jgi:tetratricopeptide (TPR) repeat protein
MTQLLTLLTALFLFNFPGDGYRDYLKKGDEFHNKFDNVNAVLNYGKAYEIEPDSYEVLKKFIIALNDAGEEYYELRQREESEKYINKAVHSTEIFRQKYPDSADVYCYMALSYGNLAIFKGGKEKIKLAKIVEENARKSLKMDPGLFVSYIILGIYNREVANLNFFERIFAGLFFGEVPEGSFEESIKMFNKALEITPKAIVPTYQLAKTYRFMGDEKKEKELYNKILKYEIRNFRDKFAVEKAKRRLQR